MFFYLAVSHKSYAWVAEQENISGRELLYRRFIFIRFLFIPFHFRRKSKCSQFALRKRSKNREKQENKCYSSCLGAKPLFQPHSRLVRKEDKDHLQSLRSRVDHVKSLLKIDRKTSSSQNADLLEQLVTCFELVMHSAGNLGSSWEASKSNTHEVRPPHVQSLLEQEHWQPSLQPQKRQICVDATVDDLFFVCSGESLKSL